VERKRVSAHSATRHIYRNGARMPEILAGDIDAPAILTGPDRTIDLPIIEKIVEA
jgi:hypothetical protein